MNNNAEDESAPTRRSTRRSALDAKTRREYEQKKRKIEVKKPDLPPQRHQSDVPLNAAPLKGAGTTTATEALKNKAALKDLDEEFAPRVKEATEDLDKADRRMKEALKTLIAAKTTLVHPRAKSLLDALEQQGGEKATAKIDPKHEAASRMQQLTNSTLSELDIKVASRNLQNHPSQTNGEFGFYKKGTKEIENKRGVKVNRNKHIVSTALWEVLEKDGRGLPDYNAGKSRNLKEKIVEYSYLLPHVFRCGKDYFLIAEEPKSWDKDKSFHDFVADLFLFSDWREMTIHLHDETHELHGMSSMRFLGDDIVPYTTRLPNCCRKAGYIFIFNDENPTRFDTASGQLSDLPEKKKPSKEAFVKKHCPDVFSVEKVGDETFGTKGFRVFRDVFAEIRNIKKNGKLEAVKKHHMPSAVGEEKLFETAHGTYKVTRLVLD